MNKKQLVWTSVDYAKTRGNLEVIRASQVVRLQQTQVRKREDEDVVDKFGTQDRNAGGQMMVDYVKRIELRVGKTFFQKRQEPVETHKSGGRSTQIDYILFKCSFGG